MIKKCSKVLFTILCTFFISLTVTYAKEYTLDELAEAVKEVEPDATYVYVIGEYVFTSEHILTTQDTMLAARTIKTSLNSGATADDPIYNEMAIVYLEGVLDEDTWELKGFEFVESVVGIATAQSKYEIKYIDYEVIETPEYQVVFKNGNDVLATETLAAGTQVQMITDDLEAGITKDDYTLVGWMNEATEEMVDENTVVDGNATYVMVWEAITTKEVSNETELLLALGNPQFTTIELKNDIDVSVSVVVGRDVTIDGKGYSISRIGTPAYVAGGNNYVLKVYGASEVVNVSLVDVKLTNSLAAVLVGDNANVTMDKVDLDGNVWGGIEVKDTATTTLTVKVENLTYTDEVYGKPVAWVDNATVENATINFTLEGSSWTVTEASVKGQVQYYLNADNAKAIALVSNEEELLLALGNNEYSIIELANDIDVSASVVVGRDVTIDGKGYSISKTGTPVYVSGGDNYALKVYGLEPSDVVIKDVKLTNAMAAMLVGDNVNVTLDGVDLDGNVWGGIEVKDTATTTLTVKVENLAYTDEVYGKPVAWVDNATVENATIDFTLDGSSWAVTEASVKGQVQYYLNSDNAKGIAVTNEEELLAALATSEQVSLNGDIELTSALTLDKDVVINGNGNTISSNGVTTGTLITINKDVNATLNDVVVDANGEVRAIKVVDGDLTLIDSTVRNGNSSSYASGVFVTEEGNVTIENSVITGNSAGVSEPTAYYAQYSSDLWIGSEATGTIKSGTIGNVYVNDNVYGNGGILTVEDGTINAVYLEYEDGAYATLNYVGGEITSLLVSTLNGNGDYVTITPEVGQTYKSGVVAE